MKKRLNVFEKIPGGVELVERYINDELTITETLKELRKLYGLDEDSKFTGINRTNVLNIKKKMVMEREKDYVKFSNLNSIQGEVVEEVEEYHETGLATIEEKLAKISKANSKNIRKIDPVLGLHGLVAEVITIMHDNPMTHEQNLKYIGARAKLFELIIKAEDGQDIDFDIDKIKAKTDKISMFVFDITSRIDQLISDVTNDLIGDYGYEPMRKMEKQLKDRLNIEKLYLDFIDTVS